MIFQKPKPDEDKRKEALSSGPGLMSAGQAPPPAPAGAPPSPPTSFVSQADMRSANADVLGRQLSQGNALLRDTAGAARDATAGVSVPFQAMAPQPFEQLGTTPFGGYGAQSFAGDVVDRTPRATQRAYENVEYTGPADAKGATGYLDAVNRIAAWQGLGDDAQVTGTAGDVLNQGLLGINQAGRGGAFQGARAAGADITPAFETKQADLNKAIADFRAALDKRNQQAKDWNIGLDELDAAERLEAQKKIARDRAKQGRAQVDERFKLPTDVRKVGL